MSKKNKRKIKKVILIRNIIAVICFLLALGIGLYFTGVINFADTGDNDSSEELVTPICCVKYSENYMLIDADENVVANVSEKPEEYPEITGLTFGNVIVGEQLDPDNVDDLEYAMNVAKDLINYGISDVDEIFVSSKGEISIYVNKVVIELGTDNRTDEKLDDLKEFYNEVVNRSGTLDMLNVDDNGLGYTFKIS